MQYDRGKLAYVKLGVRPKRKEKIHSKFVDHKEIQTIHIEIISICGEI
jgi:hypothetical protein